MRSFKLTFQQTQEIINNPGKLTQRELAKKYGVSPSYICHLQTGRQVYKEVTKKPEKNYTITDTEEPEQYNFNKRGLFDLQEWARAMSY